MSTPPTLPPAETTSLPCPNCGAAQSGRFCADCGQPLRRPRLTMSELGRRFLQGVLDLDRGILHTAVSLFRRPGAVVGDYLRGRTVTYTSPVKYFVLAVTLVQLLALWTGASSDFVSGFTESRPEDAAERLTWVFDRFFVLLAAPAVPVLAAVQRGLFPGAGWSYAEHLVMVLYLTAQQLLLWTPALAVAGISSGVADAVPLVSFAAATAYYLWGARQCFEATHGAVLPRAAASLMLTTVIYVLLVTLTLGLAMSTA